MITVLYDKKLHLLVGALVALISAPFSLPLAALLVIVAGVGKEVYDHFFGGTVDLMDIVATIAGGHLVLTLFLLFI